MSLTMQEIKKMTSEDIYKHYEKLLNKLYTEYNIFFQSKKDYTEIVETCICSNIKKNSIEKSMDILLKEYIKSYICKQIKDDNTLLVKYIDNIAIEELSDIKKLQYISKCINRISNTISFSLCIEIVSNSKVLDELISKIVEKNKKLIINNGVECLTNDYTSIQLIEMYCSLNNIDINEIELDTSELGDLFTQYMLQIPKKILTAEEEQELLKRIENNDKNARKELINHNLKLVISIAKKYRGKGLEFMDLIQEGNIGLMKAIDLYDITKGHRFSTYATYWIRQRISREIRNKGRAVRLPSNQYDKYSKIVKCIKSLENNLGRTPTIEEISNELNISVEELSKLYENFKESTSLNTKIGDGKETEIGDILPCENNNLEDNIDNSFLLADVRKLLASAKLTDKEMKILTLRFGLDGRDPMTLEEIGQMFDVTRERIRQLEAKAMGKIRRNKETVNFAVYMDSPDKALENLNRSKREYRGKRIVDTDVKNYKTLYQLCSEFSKEEVDEAVILLSDIDKEILKELYSDDLITLIKFSKIKINKVVKSIKKIITNKKKVSEKMGRKLKTLYEYFQDYSKEQVDEAIKKLTEEERDIIIRGYGNDLTNPVRSKSFSSKDTDRLYGSIIPRIKTELKGRKIDLYFYDIFKDYSKEQVDICLEKLSMEDKILLKKAYGENLEQKFHIDRQDQRYISTVIVKKIKRLLNGEKLGKNLQSLYKNFENYTKEQIDLIISTLSEEDKLLIKRAYGDDKENPERALDWTSEDSNMLYQHLFVRIKNLLKEKYLRKYFSIYERLSDFSEKEIDEVIKLLSEEDIDVLNMAYGSDYKNPKRDVLYNSDLDKKLRNILYKMKKILNKTERKKNKEIGKLYEMLKDYTKEEVNTVIDGLNDEDKELLFRAYGLDYDNPIRALDFTKKDQGKLASSLLPKIRKRLKQLKESNIVEEKEIIPEVKEETITKESYMEILALLKTPTFGELLTTLDVESAVIVVLKLGYIRDNYYSSSSIGNFLGMSEEEVNNKFVNVLELYKKSFNKFLDTAIESTKNKVLKI